MNTMMSPGVQVNEIDLSIVVPTLGNSTACFAGKFEKGPIGKYSLITNANELISVYGYPTNDNYNDWFQAYNFLQYGDKLMVSRAVASDGSTKNADADAVIDGGTLDTQVAEIYIANEDDYEIQESSIPLTGSSRIRFIAKSAGLKMNGIEIAIGREADFASGSTEVFPGIIINSLFEETPKDADNTIAVVIREGDTITGTYIVSLTPGAKDYRNKSIFIEDVLYKYDELVYAKVNDGETALPASALGANVLELQRGAEGVIDIGDIETAYGSVSDNTIFGNKEELDIDIVIANELNRKAAGKLASERADCIAFIGAKFEDVVGISSTNIVENLVNDVLTGELNSGDTANSFSAYFGNYKQQYDKYNDKVRWISVAGDIAGLRADTNTALNTWWASAGLVQGSVA